MSMNILKDRQQYKESMLITFPFEKVIAILNQIKVYINMTGNKEEKLVKDLEWVIRVIASHSLNGDDLSRNKGTEEMLENGFESALKIVNDANEEAIAKNIRSCFVTGSKGAKESRFHTPKTAQLQKRGWNGLGRKKKGGMNSYHFINHLRTKHIDQISHPIKSGFLQRTSLNNLSIYPIIKKLTKESLFKHNPCVKNHLDECKGTNSFHQSHLLDVQLLTSPLKLIDSKALFSKDFDIFELKQGVGINNVLQIIGKGIFEVFGINKTMINMPKLDSFLNSISSSYFSTVPYHNSMHGADVAHTVSLWLMNSNIKEVAKTNRIDILSIFVACLGHDIGHPGLNNSYQVNAFSEMALTYNNTSCLENFHASKLFRLIKISQNDIFDSMLMQDFRLLRRRVIRMILATDMSNHVKVLGLVKARIVKELNEAQERSSLQLISFKDEAKAVDMQQSLLDFLIHSSDLSHNTKPFHISLQWVELLSNEFWNQGDKEKAIRLPVSFLCERADHDVPKSQVSFIKDFILPTFDIFVDLFPSLSYLFLNAKENLSQWEKLVEAKRKRGWSPKSKVIPIHYPNSLSPQ